MFGIENKLKRIISSIVTLLLLAAGLILPQTAASATITEITIDSASDRKLFPSNTSRKIAVSPNGTIFLLYSGTAGNYVAKSTDGGATFSTSSSTVTPAGEAEIAVSSNGDVFLAWVVSNEVKVIRSTDSGATWGSVVDAGSLTTSAIHMAVDREYVYILNRTGTTILRSADYGSTWSSSTVSAKSWAYSDILVDPTSGVIYVFADDPSVSYYSSSNRGASFTAENVTGKQVYYSTAAIAANASNRFMYMAGSGTNFERVNVVNGSVASSTVLSERATTRNVSADGFGNVLSSGIESGTFTFQVSTDFAATFGSGVTVDTGLDTTEFSASSINQTNGDILVIYEKAGRIVFKRYSGLLIGYDLNFTTTYLDFSQAGALTITLTNTSAASITITDIGLASSVFTQTNTCSSALAVNATCVITVTAISAGSANLTINATGATGAIQRIIPLAFGASSAQANDVLAVAPPAQERKETRYTGPLLDGSNIPVAKGSTSVGLIGKKLTLVSSVVVDGSTVSFRAESDESLSISLSPTLKVGIHDVVIFSIHGKLTQMNAIRVREVMPNTSLTIKGSDVFSGEEFKKLTAFSRTQNPEMNTAICIVNSSSEGKSFMQARALCDRIAASNLNIKTTMFEARSTVEGSAIFARVIFSSDQ
jgi:hypothetical protein